MLEEDIAKDIASILGWAIERARKDGEQLQADRIKTLKAYLAPSHQNQQELFTASDLARRGGLAKSEKKAAKAKENAMKYAGPPGHYYGYARKNRDTVEYVSFSSKLERNEWVDAGPPGVRDRVPATDTGLRREKRDHPERILDGDQIYASLVDADQFEGYHDIG